MMITNFTVLRKGLKKQFVLKNIKVIFQSHKVRHFRVQGKIIGKAENKSQQHRQKQEDDQQYQGRPEKTPFP